MTIKVVSTSDPAPVNEAESAKVEGEASPEEKTQSAPAPEKEPEQKESPESEPEEAEAEENEQADESEEDAAEKEASAKDAEKEKTKKKSGFQRRVDKLNAAKAEAQREAEYWKRAALERGATEPKTEAKTQPKADPGRPNPDNFETHAEYVEAVADWKAEQKLAARDAKDAEAKASAEAKQIWEGHSKRVEAFAEKHDDFQEVIEELAHIKPTPATEEYIVSSEHGPALLYELAKDPKEAERINSLPPVQAARALALIEARISQASGEKTTTETKTTKAPKPLTPVGSKGSSVKKTIYDKGLSQKEFEALRAEQRAASGR